MPVVPAVPCMSSPMLLDWVQLRTLPPLLLLAATLDVGREGSLLSLLSHSGLGMVAYTFNPSTYGAEMAESLSSRTARTTERPCPKNTKLNDSEVTLEMDTPVILSCSS